MSITWIKKGCSMEAWGATTQEFYYDYNGIKWCDMSTERVSSFYKEYMEHRLEWRRGWCEENAKFGYRGCKHFVVSFEKKKQKDGIETGWLITWSSDQKMQSQWSIKAVPHCKEAVSTMITEIMTDEELHRLLSRRRSAKKEDYEIVCVRKRTEIPRR